MPIPPGAKQVPGNPNRVRLADGTVVTRSRARTLAAQLEGFTSETARRKNPEKQQANERYFKAWVRTRAGQEAVKQARTQAKTEGRAYRPAELRVELIAARNDRPHPGTNKPGGETWLAFARKYGLTGFTDYVRY